MHITRLQNGRSTEDYYKNPTLFPFRQLLTDFGINEETATIMFADKGVFYIVLYIELLQAEFSIIFTCLFTNIVRFILSIDFFIAENYDELNII